MQRARKRRYRSTSCRVGETMSPIILWLKAPGHLKQEHFQCDLLFLACNRQSRQSAGASDPHPHEERGRRKPARIRSAAESTEADRSGVVQGTEAPAAVRSFFVMPPHA